MITNRKIPIPTPKTPIYDFTAEGTEPYFVKVLVNPHRSWTGYFHESASLSYCFPTATDYLQTILTNLNGFITEITSITNEDTKSDMRETLGYWQSVANLAFTETEANDNKCQMPIYEFKQKPQYAAGYATWPFFDKTLGIMRSYGIGLYTDEYDTGWDRFQYPREALKKTQAHEFGHLAMGFNHGFDSTFKFQTKTENATTYSILNYDKETYAIYDLQPMMPMPHDIEAAQFVYGAPNINTGNDTHYFKSLTPRQGVFSWLSLNKPVFTLPWDNSGIDTLSAEEIYARHLIIDINPYGRSQIGNNIFMTPNMDIENVIGGETDNNIILNALNNIVDVSKATDTSRIIVDPKNCGDDIIFGFQATKDQIILRISEGSEKPTWTVTAVQGAEVTLADSIKKYKSGTKIQFSDNNAVILADVSPGELTGNIIQIKSTSEIETLLWDLSDYLPKELAQDFAAAFLKSTLLAFILSLNEQIMKKYGCNDKQIAAVNSIGLVIMIAVSGQYIPSLAGFVTNSILSYRGCKPANCSTASTMVTLGAQTLLTVSTPDQLLNLIVTMLGSAIGSKLTHAVVNKIANPSAPTLSNPSANDSALYKRFRDFTLWTCKKITTKCLGERTNNNVVPDEETALIKPNNTHQSRN